jgi:hypothetical protein
MSTAKVATGADHAAPRQPTHNDIPSTFERMARIDCSEHMEARGQFSYLSWAWAVDYLLRDDPTATWTYHFFDGKPYCLVGDTAMVFCTVRAHAIERTAQLPVMDHRNKPISNPDSFQVNTAMQRCLAKAIALHGLGLYIYQGEDLPVEDSQPVAQVKSTRVSASEVAVIEKLAGLAGVKHQAILDKYQVGSLAQIEKKYLDEIVKKLQQRISEKDERKAA